MAKRPSLPRAQFGDGETYANALYAASGPGYGEVDALTHLPGEAASVMRAVWGDSQAAFEAALEAEDREAQRRRPGVFVRKHRRRRSSRARPEGAAKTAA
jgi:hypothetical protein